MTAEDENFFTNFCQKKTRNHQLLSFKTFRKISLIIVRQEGATAEPGAVMLLSACGALDCPRSGSPWLNLAAKAGTVSPSLQPDFQSSV